MMAASHAISAPDAKPQSLLVTAPDGLRLHVRAYGPRIAPGFPVVCLPGLSRTGADFATLARALTQDPERPRRVLALDYRGRGGSDYDRNPANYSLPVELADVLAVLTAQAALPAVFVGTSRGGILAMLLAALRPTALAGAVLNDIGPVIEGQGLMRIKSYIGKLPQPRTFDEAAELLRRIFGAQFPRLSQAEWLAYARRSWSERDGRPAGNYDPRLAKALAHIDPEQPLPVLWPQFNALAHVPVMVIRGANSDLLSAATLAEMQKRRPDLQTLEVADQGHAPLLEDDAIVARIAGFVAHCEDPIGKRRPRADLQPG